MLPFEEQTCQTSGFRVNDYYSGFMRDHFVFEEHRHRNNHTVTQSISSKLSKRLENRGARISRSNATSPDHPRIPITPVGQ
jgi:hypothetical protein